MVRKYERSVREGFRSLQLKILIYKMKILKFEGILKMEDYFKSKCQYGGNRRKLCDNYFDCGVCYARSFGASERSLCWNYKENKGLTPRDVSLNSHTKFWFICQECKHDFETQLNSVNKGHWCSYCANQNICNNYNCEFCFKKSFASHDKAKFWNYKENKIKPRDVFKSSGKQKFWFKCEDCKHDFESTLNNVNTGYWCPYCCYPPQKLCTKDCELCYKKSFASHPRAKFWHKKRNKKIKPRDVFKNCNKKFWFTCPECKHDFKSNLSSISGRNRWCPYCKNKTEKMFADWLVDEKIPFEREKKFDWCINLETDRHLPFDFYLPNHNVIIEIDGRQHVEEVKHFKNSFETIQERDGYKENCAIENGIHVIRICQEDIFHNRIDWGKQVLERLEEIKNKEPEIFCLHSGGFYEV